MKVKIELTVDIDPAIWAALYDVPLSDVREDVRDYVRNIVETQLAENQTQERRN